MADLSHHDRMAARLWHPVARYGDMVRLWIRAELSYPASFAMLVVGSMMINALDFASIAIMFSSIDSLGGFGLREIALLYGATGVGIGVADTAIGSVERIGEFVRTGRLDQMLTKIADFYEDQVNASVKSLTSILEPVMLVVVGGIVGFIVISMYLPLFKVYDQIK